MAKKPPTTEESIDNIKAFKERKGKGAPAVEAESDATLSEDEAVEEYTEEPNGQQIIPGAAKVKKYPALERQADVYREYRETMQGAVKEFKVEKEKLRDMMHERKLDTYPLPDGEQIVVKPTEEKVSVGPAKGSKRKKKDIDLDDDSGEGDE